MENNDKLILENQVVIMKALLQMNDFGYGDAKENLRKSVNKTEKQIERLTQPK